MSEFNIKQQNRNKFKASKEKKQTAKFKQTEKLFRNQHFDRQSNASESSESVELPNEKKRYLKFCESIRNYNKSHSLEQSSSIESQNIARRERRKNRERKQNQENAESNQIESGSVESASSVANRELDNPSPCSSKSLDSNRDHRNTKENNPTMCQNAQKAKPQKVLAGDFQQKKQSKTPDQFPRPFKKVKAKNNETKTMTFEQLSPVPKLQKTNFQWFNPSAGGSDDSNNANEPFSKNRMTNKSNESLINKAPKDQRNLHSPHKGQNSQQSAPFTTAGMSQTEMKTVRGFFAEPSTSKSIDSDLSNKYDCSKDKHPNQSWRSEANRQENRNSFSDFRSQLQPFPHDKSKEESSIDEGRDSKKYRKRPIKTHANRDYVLPAYEDDQEGEDFDDLSGATFSVSSHFLMKEQKEWLEQSESCTNPFALNLKCLAAALHTIPFHQRQSMPENIFTSDEMINMTSEADSNIQIYEEVRHDAEEERKIGVFREADDSILKDDFISDFLSFGDSFSTEKSKSNEGNEESFIIDKAGSSYILNLELDEDDFESPFSTYTIVSQKSKSKKNRKSKKPSNQEKAITGNSVEDKRNESDCSRLLNMDSDGKNLLDSSSEDESTIQQEQKSKMKNNTTGSPATKGTHSGSGKNREQISSKKNGDKFNSSPKFTEKRSNFDSSTVPTSSFTHKSSDANVEKKSEQILINEDPISDLFQSPSQSTEKRTRVRGSSAFNITESLSDLIAENSAPITTSNTIGSLNMESSSCETGGKSPSTVPDSKKMENLETDFKRLNFGSPTNFKFDFKKSSLTLPSKASNPFEAKTVSPSSIQANESHDSRTRNTSPFRFTSNPNDTFKTQTYTPSPPKKSSTFKSKNKSPPPAKLASKFDLRKTKEKKIQENYTSVSSLMVEKRIEQNSKNPPIPSLVVTPTNKTTPAIDIVDKSLDSLPVTRCNQDNQEGGASSIASESPSTSSSKPVIDDDAIDILLGITNQTPNQKNSSSEDTNNGHSQSGINENQQDTADTKTTSTSMLDENLDDWLDSVLQN